MVLQSTLLQSTRFVRYVDRMEVRHEHSRPRPHPRLRLPNITARSPAPPSAAQPFPAERLAWSCLGCRVEEIPERAQRPHTTLWPLAAQHARGRVPLILQFGAALLCPGSASPISQAEVLTAPAPHDLRHPKVFFWPKYGAKRGAHVARNCAEGQGGKSIVAPKCLALAGHRRGKGASACSLRAMCPCAFLRCARDLWRSGAGSAGGSGRCRLLFSTETWRTVRLETTAERQCRSIQRKRESSADLQARILNNDLHVGVAPLFKWMLISACSPGSTVPPVTLHTEVLHLGALELVRGAPEHANEDDASEHPEAPGDRGHAAELEIA
jgi:hypothetical protein